VKTKKEIQYNTSPRRTRYSMQSGTVILLLSRTEIRHKRIFIFFVSLAVAKFKVPIPFHFCRRIRFKRKRQKHLGRREKRKRDVYNILLRLRLDKHVSITNRRS